MVTNISKEDFSKLLDELNISSKFSESGYISVILEADKDFEYDVNVDFSVDEKNGELTGLSTVNTGFDIPDNELAHAYVICNDWNKSKIVHAYVDKNKFWLNYSVFIDEPVSENFIKENFIKICTASSLKFFHDLVK